MASAAASVSADMKTERLSFAKIAAAGIKPPSTQQQNSNNTTNPNIQQKQDITSQPRDGAPIVTPSNGAMQPSNALKPKKIVQLVSRRSQGKQEADNAEKSGLEVRVQAVESVPKQPRQRASEGSLVPAPDDSGTQVSSSSGSNKPHSLDGKSVASGTNFTLDEKDSLRPDDSASVKAVDEDDLFSPPGSGLPSSRIGSDDGVRAAFRDQLREISSAEARGRPTQLTGAPSRGVLYVPPQGPGIGPVPNVIRSIPEDGAGSVECPPDQKLLEALDNPRDRVWVLKLEQDVIDFVKDPKESSMTLPQCHSFYRLLAHKMADYYMLGHHVEDTSAAVRLYKTPECRIPPPLTGVTAPSTAASTPPPTAPQMKILRRDNGPAIANGSNMPSKSGSENGDSGDEKKKGPVTREEREARYEAARLRIMGSAKPIDMTEAPKEKQDSRASSTTGKKNKKTKARMDDDDGFEARSAYANYYAPQYGSDGPPTQPSYRFAEFSDGTQGHYADSYGTPVPTGSQARAVMQSVEHAPWTQTPFDPSQSWTQGQPGGYDVSADFQRSMTFQNQVPAPTSSNVGYGAGYGSQYYGAATSWPQQQYQIPAQSPHSAYGFGVAPPSQYGQPHQEHAYAFGQLPSQAFPGKAPSKTEHPLPGSYKGKHFNPQSQTFVPGQANASRPFTPQQGPSSGANAFTNFSSPAQLQRQTSAQSQGSAFGSPHHGSPHHHSPHMMQSRLQNQTPLMHPLPQPVFPRQPSPSLPLPPKPGAISQQQTAFANGVSPPHGQQNQSLLAKWGTPASLPAKPPISAEQYEAMKAQQMPRQTFGNPAVASPARPPNAPGPAYPSFGSMPQPGPGQIVNGSYSGGNRRV